jgi:carboxymethylenebutenolidase
MAQISTANVTYSINGEAAPGFLARPQSDGPYPGVVVIQEIWGLDDHIRDVASRFAREGFIALAPDLYSGEVRHEIDEARKLAMALDREKVDRQLAKAVEFVRGQEGCNGKVGVTGFCMGGRLALALAIGHPEVDAVVPWYGGGTGDLAKEAGSIACPVLGIYGDEDRGIPVEDVYALERALTQAGVKHEIHLYHGAPHGFFNDTNASAYREEFARDAWAQCLRWFRTYLA